MGESASQIWLSPAQLSRRSGVELQKLAVWRCRGVGPRWRRAPGTRTIQYSLADVEFWERQCELEGEKNL